MISSGSTVPARALERLDEQDRSGCQNRQDEGWLEHLAYKPSMRSASTRAYRGAPIHAADVGDTTTLGPLEKNHSAVGVAPTPEDPFDLLADKGYHSCGVLKEQEGGPWKTRIAEPRASKGYRRRHGDDEARAAVYANRNRLRSGVGKEAIRKRGDEMVDRSFAHVLERGGMRRTWLRGRESDTSFMLLATISAF